MSTSAGCRNNHIDFSFQRKDFRLTKRFHCEREDFANTHPLRVVCLSR